MNDALKDDPANWESAGNARRRRAQGRAEALLGEQEFAWAKLASDAIEEHVPSAQRSAHVSSRVINLMPGAHETLGAVSELKETVEAFGFGARVLPELSHPRHEQPLASAPLCGTPLSEIEKMAGAVRTVAVGEHMRQPARLLKTKTGVPLTVLPSVIGLEASDRLIALLSDLSGRSIPTRIAKQRAQLLEAMGEVQSRVTGKRVGIFAEPDLLRAFVRLFERLGAEVPLAVNCTKGMVPLGQRTQHVQSPKELASIAGLTQEDDLDLLVGNSKVEPLARSLGIPLFLVGSPIIGRVGHQYRALGGYRGTRELVSEIGEVFSARSRRWRAERREETLVYLPRTREAHRVGA